MLTYCRDEKDSLMEILAMLYEGIPLRKEEIKELEKALNLKFIND